MNKRVIVYVLGAVLLIEATLMLLPLLVAVIYREKNGWYFLWVLLGAAVLGALALGLGGRKRSAMYAKEGLIAVALSWIVLSLVGAVPFTLSREIPSYLAEPFTLDRRHGHSRVHAGHRSHGRGTGHSSAARRKPRTDGVQDGPAHGRFV